MSYFQFFRNHLRLTVDKPFRTFTGLQYEPMTLPGCTNQRFQFFNFCMMNE